MEISNLTLGRENKRIFQEKLLLPWVRDVRQKKKKKKEKESINQILKKNEGNKKKGSLDQTISEQCALLFRTEPKRKGKRKGKGPNNQSQIFYQNPTL